MHKSGIHDHFTEVHVAPGMLSKTLNHNMYLERDYLKKVILKNFLIQLKDFNKNKLTAKSVTFKKITFFMMTLNLLQ
jgi:hypothetical protein